MCRFGILSSVQDCFPKVIGNEINENGVSSVIRRSDVLFHVEVRHLSQGFGDVSWNLLRRCDYEFCNKKGASELCPHIEVDADSDSAVKFLMDYSSYLHTMARRSLALSAVPFAGWGMKDIVQGEQEPSIL